MRLFKVMDPQFAEVYCRFPVKKSIVVPEFEVATDLMEPLTSRAVDGAVIPIPTLPVLVILILSDMVAALLVKKVRLPVTFVPEPASR